MGWSSGTPAQHMLVESVPRSSVKGMQRNWGLASSSIITEHTGGASAL